MQNGNPDSVDNPQILNALKKVQENHASTYTRIDYKASGGNSAVENMIAGAKVGSTSSTYGVLWERISDSSGDLSDFKARTPLHPRPFGAALDGVSNDRAAFQLMFDQYSNGAREFDLGWEDAYLGEITTHYGSIFRFVRPEGLKIYGTGTLFVKNSMTAYNTFESVIELVDPIDCDIDIKSEGDIYDPLDPKGVASVMLVSDTQEGRDIRIKSSCTNGLAAVQSSVSWREENRPRTPSDPDIENINIDSTCNTAKYGLRLIDCGNNFNAKVNTKDGGRGCSLVGVSNGHVEINSKSQSLVSDCLIKAYRNGCSNITVNLNQKDSINSNWPIQIEHQNDEQDTVIEGITVNLISSGRTSPTVNGLSAAVIGRSLTSSGSENATTSCVTTDIKINVTDCDKDSSMENNPTFKFPSKPNEPCLIETNAIGQGFRTNGFTIKTGRTFRASTVLDPATNPVKIFFGDSLGIPGYAILKIAVHGTTSRDNLSLSLTNLEVGYYHAPFRASPPDGSLTLLNELINVNNVDYGFSMDTTAGAPILVVSSTRTDTSLNGLFSVTATIETGTDITG